MELSNKIRNYESSPENLILAREIEGDFKQSLSSLYLATRPKNIAQSFVQIFYNTEHKGIGKALYVLDNHKGIPEFEESSLDIESKEYLTIGRKINDAFEKLPGEYFIFEEFKKNASELDNLKRDAAKFYWALGNGAMKPINRAAKKAVGDLSEGVGSLIKILDGLDSESIPAN